jgi:hypothetical protein
LRKERNVHPETTRCLACGSTDLVGFPHAAYSCCRNCRSLVQTSAIEEVPDYYEERSLDFHHQIRNYREYLKLMAGSFDTSLHFLIDVGAGDGTFLEVAGGRFRSARGCDLSPRAQRVLRDKGFDIDPASIPGIEGKVVTCFQVIEHQKDPRAFVAGLGCGATDWLVLTAPAADGPNSLRHWKTGSWAGLSPSHHVCLYSRAGIRALLADCGLQLVAYSIVWAAGQSFSLQVMRFALSCAKWPLKIILGRNPPLPVYSGIDSFLAVAQKKS